MQASFATSTLYAICRLLYEYLIATANTTTTTTTTTMKKCYPAHP